MGNQPGSQNYQRENSSGASGRNSANSANSAVDSNETSTKRNQFQKRHTTNLPTITTTMASGEDGSSANAKPRRVSEGGNPMMIRTPEIRRNTKQPSPVPEMDEISTTSSSRQSPSMQRINILLAQAQNRRASAENSPVPSPPVNATSYLTAAAASEDSSTTTTTADCSSQQHHSRRLSVSVENAFKDALNKGAQALSKSPRISRKFFKGHPEMNFFTGRRSRRGSETDQGPLFDVKPSGPPQVPAEEIFNPAHDDISARELMATQPRMRARTIGNAQATNYNRIENAAMAAAAARKRRNAANEHHKHVIPTVFRYPGDGISGPDTKIYVFGSMSNWKCLEMSRPKGETDFVRIIDCVEGKVFYRFNVDGMFKYDPRQEHKQIDSGKAWNHITVKRSDSDVFEALACDSFSLRDSRYDTGKQNDSDRLEESDWNQEKPTQTFMNSPKNKGPPLLPPHLLQVLLNKEFAAFNDPVLLPEPSHVTLDHLYAQSIRDNMLVLSTTTRFRKKCVTMVLYKPI